jgi:hypothetical protein
VLIKSRHLIQDKILPATAMRPFRTLRAIVLL